MATASSSMLDAGKLQRWLERKAGGDWEGLEARRLPGGQSNVTWRIDTRRGSFVLRMRPPGPTLPGAHAVDREARVLKALAGSAVPVPRVLATCEDETVAGGWFYVMDHMHGRALRDPRFPEVPRDDRLAHQRALIDTLAALHAIDPVAVGLRDFGRPVGYLQRQVERWSRQYRDDREAGRDPAMDNLVDWLRTHLPPGGESAIVHGDFRVDNTIFDAHQPKLVAVLDWELSTLGHPLADFAYHAMMFRLPPSVQGGLAGTDLAAHGLMGEAEAIALYCERTGRDEIPDFAFHMAFNLFRFAAILHGVRGRLARGSAVGTNAREAADMFERVAAIGWEHARASGG